ncbi:MAG: hypothetical protein M9949_06770 [Candidatus Kapabacteria bacterium]|nr:hypothetical protein [Candidatus Kapabacteria bacterium]
MRKMVKLEEAQDGMVLAEPILNNFNQTLLAVGATLNPQKLRILRTWNIKLISIKSEDSDNEIEFSDEILDVCKGKLEKRMLWKPRNNIELDLLQSAIYVSANEFYE